MKKFVLFICVSFLLMVGTVNAFVVEVGFDPALDFSLINGFEFTIDNLDTSAINSLTLEKKFQNNGGALPAAFSATFPWAIVPTMTGYVGFDNADGEYPLEPGIAFSLTGPNPFTLSDFKLAYDGAMDGKYPLSFSVSKEAILNGDRYTIVPVPSSLLLLGGGLFALVGITRRKK